VITRAKWNIAARESFLALVTSQKSRDGDRIPELSRPLPIHWRLLGSTGDYWRLLGITRDYMEQAHSMLLCLLRQVEVGTTDTRIIDTNTNTILMFPYKFHTILSFASYHCVGRI